MNLLAEIHNKISQMGSNLSDRLEDKLTGDFFGTIRYLPFEHGLKHVLLTAEFSQEYTSQAWLDYIEGQKGYIGQLEFWYRDDVEGEIDLLITSEQAVIGIEVKYLSGISSEDEVDGEGSPIDYTVSVNQLARYSRMLEKISAGRDAYLLFLAPYEMMNSVKKSMVNRTIASPAALKHLPTMRDGYLYSIEVDLEGEDGYPTLSLVRYSFDYSKWTRVPAVSDHWVFWDPFRVDKFFTIDKTEELWTSVPLEKAKDRYWGIQQVVAVDIPLMSVASAVDIKTKIFQELENLPVI